MTRVRYLLIWCIAAFMVMFFVSWEIERQAIESEATQVKTLTELAADSALQAGLGIDDLLSEYSTSLSWYDWTDGSGTNLNALRGKPLTVMYHRNRSDTHYTEDKDLFQWYMDRESVTRADAFAYLYDGTGKGIGDGGTRIPSEQAKEFMAFAKKSVNSYTYIPYFKSDASGVSSLIWVKVPRIALIGARCIWTNQSDYNASLYSAGWSSMSNDVKYGWDALSANGYLYARKGGVSSAFGSYYLTPTKVGVSYINRDLVEKLYQNNLDLIMRYKYNDTDLREGNGMPESPYIPQTDTVEHNMAEIEDDLITNGLFSVSKDTSTITNIEYKIVDVYDSANNDLIEQLYGGYVDYRQAGGGGNVLTGSIDDIGIMTAQKLLERGTLTIPNADGTYSMASESNLVVAKVTFSTDVLLNYKTGVFTVWRTKYDGDSGTNYNDLIQTTGIATNRISDSLKYAYTRYWAVTA